MSWEKLIEFRPPYQTGYLKGTNTRVLRVMLCLANGWTISQILMMHPELNAEHIEACWNYGESVVGSDRSGSTDSTSRLAFDSAL